MSPSIVLLLGSLLGSISFNVDWSAFRAGGDSGRVEFFYSIPFDQLSYTQSDSGITAPFSVRMAMSGVDNGFRQEGTVYKRARLTSFEEASRVQRTFVDGFSIIAPPGRYRFEMTVAESSKVGANTGTVSDSLQLAGFSGGLKLSSLQLGASALSDTVTGAVSVVPTPSRRFALSGTDVIYVYYEAYNMRPESSAYRVQLAVLGPGTDTAVKTPKMNRSKSGTRAASALGVSVEGLKPGDYLMTMALTDLVTGQVAFGERPFALGTVKGQAGGFNVNLDSLSDQERMYYRDIQYIATPREVAYYNSLSESGKDVWLASFWSKHNLTEFARRLETAESRFRRQRTPGVRTDRGRIYVKYGEPDAIEQKVIETQIRPREYWHYYSSGYVYVFVDIRGDGNYRLAYTNNKDEPPTGFESYLTPDEQEQWGQ